MSALRSCASKADVRLERKLRYEFAKLKATGQVRLLYRTQYAKPVAGPTTTVSTVQTVAGHAVLVSEPYTPTIIGGKSVGVQADPQRNAQNRQRRTDNLAEGVPQTPMSFQNQGIHATSPDNGIDLCDDAASEVPPHGAVSSLARRVTQEGVDVSAQAHVDLVSEVIRLREFVAHVQTALDQSVTERKQLRENLDQVQRPHEQSSTELAQLREQMNRLGSINSVDKRLRKVEYNLPRMDGQVELLMKMQPAGTTSHPRAQAPSGPREKDHDMIKLANVKHWVGAQLA
uniref:Uncharacterized protein n=1 Tax=Hyaloperonospora arabidopsidis (strain Emoy2) TaxID=559515 RepID=M4C5H6_HYAAE